MRAVALSGASAACVTWASRSGRCAPGARRARPPRRSRPCSRTTMRSASRIVDRRCATTRVVRPFMRRPSASFTSSSDSGSRALVASSSRRIRGSRTSARAIASRCRWPPERRAPRSPTTVSQPSRLAADELERVGGAERLGHDVVRSRAEGRTRCCRGSCPRRARTPAARPRRPGAPSEGRAAACRRRRAGCDQTSDARTRARG